MDEDELACIDFRKNCELGECEDLEFAIKIDSCQKSSDLDKEGSLSTDQPQCGAFYGYSGLCCWNELITAIGIFALIFYSDFDMVRCKLWQA